MMAIAPAVAALRRWVVRLSYSAKFAVVAALFALPLVAAVSAITYGQFEAVRAAARERAGVALLRQLAPLQYEVQRYSRLSYDAATGDEGARAELPGAREAVDAGFAAIARSAGERTTAADALARIAANWGDQNAKLTPIGPASRERVLTGLLEDLHVLATRIGDEAGLASESELDVARLAELLAQQLGEAQLLEVSGLRDVRAALEGRTGRSVQLIRDATELRAAVRQLNTAGHAAFYHDASAELAPVVEQPLRDYVAAVEAFLAHLDSTAAGRPPPARSVADAARLLSERRLALGDAIAVALERQLAARQRRLLIGLVCVGGGAAALLAAGLAAGLLLTRTISRPLRELILATNRFAAGDVEARAPVASDDEVGRVGAAFNAMAAEVGRARLTLEERVSERTSELARALEVAQEALRARAEFVGIASHELRTPIAGLLGFSELWLQDTDPADPSRIYAEKVHQCAEQLTSLTESLLDVSRMDEGRVTLHREAADLAAIVPPLLASFQVTAPRHQLLADVEPDARWVLADRTKLAQILQNLVSNAIKFSPDGGQVLVRARADPTTGRVVTSVIDQGIGVPTRDRARIFGRFERVDEAATQGIRGVGLGLYIVRNLVELHGGAIEIESVVGRGSTFRVALPAAPLVAV